MTRYWLFKSEPDAFSFEDLRRQPRRTACWDGVRNYQARNLLRDEVGEGDGVLFYHSSCKVPAVVGTATVVRAGYPDPTAFDPEAKSFDPRSDPARPTWYAVDVRAGEAFASPVDRDRLRAQRSLAEMLVLRRGQRLSVQPVTAREWRTVLKLGGL